jgi:coproporphyrinogen III oxidase
MSAVDIEPIKSDFHRHVCDLQDRITAALLAVDPSCEVVRDRWTRTDAVEADGGGGDTRAFSGSIIENAGVNTSLIYGEVSADFAAKLPGSGTTIWATGISLIIHPRNPHIPTVHANFRMIELGTKAWFGGGADLTPYYPHEDDFCAFHRTLAEACAPYEVYDEMKAQCDAYFVNHHRDGEMRGIGGLFFDALDEDGPERDAVMVKALSEAFMPSYFPIVERRKDLDWSEQDEAFQLFRRGRYVEFNLLHDRGTKFGLQTKGRVPSILISLPARCHFSYTYEPAVGSPHERMASYYWPRDWLAAADERSIGV